MQCISLRKDLSGRYAAGEAATSSAPAGRWVLPPFLPFFRPLAAEMAPTASRKAVPLGTGAVSGGGVTVRGLGVGTSGRLMPGTGMQCTLWFFCAKTPSVTA